MNGIQQFLNRLLGIHSQSLERYQSTLELISSIFTSITLPRKYSFPSSSQRNAPTF